MKVDKRWIIVFCLNLLTLNLCLWMNHILATQGLWVGFWGVFIVFTAIYLPLRPACVVTILTGLSCESLLPMPFGFLMVPMMVVMCLLSYMHHFWEIRYRHQVTWLIQGTNTVLWLWLIWRHMSWDWIYLQTAVLNWFLSGVVLMGLGPLYCQVASTVLIHTGCKLKTQVAA